jgi:hypothetical protein
VAGRVSPDRHYSYDRTSGPKSRPNSQCSATSKPDPQLTSQLLINSFALLFDLIDSLLAALQ